MSFQDELPTVWLARALVAIEVACSEAAWFAVECGDWLGVDDAFEQRRVQRAFAVRRVVRAISDGSAPLPEVPEDEDQSEPPY